MTKLNLAALLFLFSVPAFAQKRPAWIADHDTAYYHSYRDRLTVRGYLSRKYSSLHFNAPDGFSDFRYRPNTSLNVGVGATYHAITVNLGFGINRFNPDEARGRTRYLDLQGHFFMRKWKVDFLGSFYRGYYLSPEGLVRDDGKYYTRRDLGLQLGGVAVYRTLNDRSFSYQAGLLQTEWQKKSAGSVVIGAETYYGAIQGDSALVPSKTDSQYHRLDIRKLHFFQIGPGAGYAYTLVIRQHYFLLGSATVNVALRYVQEETAHTRYPSNVSLAPNFFFHAGAGYNTERWSLSVLWIGSRLRIKGNESGYRYAVNTGNYRLIYAQRLRLDRKAKKLLQPIPDVMGQ